MLDHLQRLDERALEVVVPERGEVLVHVGGAHQLLGADPRQLHLAVVLLREATSADLATDCLALG